VHLPDLPVLGFDGDRYVLIAGLALHLANANSFLGLTKENPIMSGRAYAVLAIVGFSLGIFLFARAF